MPQTHTVAGFRLGPDLPTLCFCAGPLHRSRSLRPFPSPTQTFPALPLTQLRGSFSDTPERHLPTPGQRVHSPQRHTAAGTAAFTTTDMGNAVPQRAK